MPDQDFKEITKPLLRIRSDGSPLNTLVTTEDGQVIPVTKVTWTIGTDPVMSQATVEVPLASIDVTTRDYLLKDSTGMIWAGDWARVRELITAMETEANHLDRLNIGSELRGLLLGKTAPEQP